MISGSPFYTKCSRCGARPFDKNIWTYLAGIKKFLILRAATFFWGFIVAFLFTGDLIFTSQMWLVIFAGNSVIMWGLVKQ